MCIRDVVFRHFAMTVGRYSPIPFPTELADEARLDSFWIDSVAFAALLSGLERDLGDIPRVLLEGISFPETFGDLVSIYEEAARTRAEPSDEG